MAMNASAKECGVCNEEFDEEVRCPRIIPCSHTLCTSCIDKLIRSKTKQCPFCRRGFKANCSSDFMKNLTVMELMKYISAVEGLISKPAPVDRVPPRKNIIENLKKETLETSSLYLINCQEAEKQIEKTLNEIINLEIKIKEENTRIENDVFPKLQNVISQNNKMLEELCRTKTNLKDQMKEVKGKDKQLKTMKGNIESCKAETFSETAALLDKVLETNTAIEYWIENFKQIISEEEKTLRMTEKVIKRIKQKINSFLEFLNSEEGRDEEEVENEVVEEEEEERDEEEVENEVVTEEEEESDEEVENEVVEEEEEEERDEEEVENYVVEEEEEEERDEELEEVVEKEEVEEVEGEEDEEKEAAPILDMAAMAIQEDNLPTQITTETLREMNAQVKHLVDQGRLYAIQHHEGMRRTARISFSEDEKLCLHHLKKEPLPSNVHVIDHEDVMRLVDPSSRLVFLELFDGRSTLGRLFIRLHPYTKVASNFACLCIGEKGPSYANTNIFWVDNKGSVHEWVRGGDYESNNGRGGKALVPGVCEEEEGWECEESWLSGSVVTYGKMGKARAAQFRIYTRNNPRQKLSLPPIGMVEEGLNVLTEAIISRDYLNIKEIAIKDCGVVLPR